MLKRLLRPLALRLGISAWRNRRAQERYHAEIEATYPLNHFETTIGRRVLRFRTEGAREKIWFHSRYKIGDLHEQPATEELLRRIGPSDNFLDVGPYFGWYSCVAAVAAPNGRVLAVELDLDNFAVLSSNVAENHLWNVETMQAGAFDSEGEVYVTRDPLSVSPERAIDTNGQGMKVRSVVLDDVLAGKRFTPQFIKIDVEGAETAVLKGLRATLSQFSPILFVEVHREKLKDFGSSTQELLMLLESVGYYLHVFTDHRGEGSLVPLPASYEFGENEMVLAITDRA